MQLKQRQTYLDKSGAQWAVSLTRWRSESTKLGRNLVFWKEVAVVQSSTQLGISSFYIRMEAKLRSSTVYNFSIISHSLPCVMCDLFSHCAVYVMWQRCTPVTCRRLWQPHPPITARTVHCGKCRSIRTMLKDDCKHNPACVYLLCRPLAVPN